MFDYLGTQAAIARGTRKLLKILADLDIVHMMLLCVACMTAFFKI